MISYWIQTNRGGKDWFDIVPFSQQYLAEYVLRTIRKTPSEKKYRLVKRTNIRNEEFIG